MREFLVGPASEIPDGGRKVVQCGQFEIGIFRVKGELVAWHNTCPHRQGPICQGRVYQRVVEPVDEKGEVRMLQYDDEHLHLVCPWHGYEFAIETGWHPAKRSIRLARVAVDEEGGDVYVAL